MSTVSATMHLGRDTRIEPSVGKNSVFLDIGDDPEGAIFFRDKETLVRVIATLMTMQQEWDRVGKEAEEFAAEAGESL